MSILTLLLSGLVVFITHALEAITGFGCTVLALPFITGLLGVQVGVPILAAIAWLLALYIVITKFRWIVFKEFFTILLFVALGMPLGMYAFKTWNPGALKKALAVFIVISAAWQLWRRFKPPRGSVSRSQATCPAAPRSELPPSFWAKWPYFLLLIVGGIVHGAFASGGPLVVLYASKALPDKGNFRATLCLLWTTLNTVLLVNYLASGILSGPVLAGIGSMIPFLVAGIFVGEKVHDRANADFFGKLVFTVLLITGIFMLFMK